MRSCLYGSAVGWRQVSTPGLSRLVVAQEEGEAADIPQIAVNDFQSFDFVLEKTSFIAELICRYALVEEIMLQSTLPAAKELKSALVQLYVSIMNYLASVRAFYNQSTAS